MSVLNLGCKSNDDEMIGAALLKAWELGQRYWQQSDSNSLSANAKADKTRNEFDILVKKTIAMLKDSGRSQPHPLPGESRAPLRNER